MLLSCSKLFLDGASGAGNWTGKAWKRARGSEGSGLAVGRQCEEEHGRDRWDGMCRTGRVGAGREELRETSGRWHLLLLHEGLPGGDSWGQGLGGPGSPAPRWGSGKWVKGYGAQPLYHWSPWTSDHLLQVEGHSLQGNHSLSCALLLTDSLFWIFVVRPGISDPGPGGAPGPFGWESSSLSPMDLMGGGGASALTLGRILSLHLDSEGKEASLAPLAVEGGVVIHIRKPFPDCFRFGQQTPLKAVGHLSSPPRFSGPAFIASCMHPRLQKTTPTLLHPFPLRISVGDILVLISL